MRSAVLVAALGAAAPAAAPSDETLMAAWPAAAARRGTEGDAVARCVADRSGALSRCEVLIQRPARAGFGEALLSLAPHFRLKPATSDERPAGATVYITANWPVPDVAPDWRVEPKEGDFSVTATPQAWRSGGEGSAVMNCRLGVRGTLYDCRVFYQDPPNMGFGAMALMFAPHLRYTPAMRNGRPIRAGVNLPFHFGRPD